jgi:hypothetical protein
MIEIPFNDDFTDQMERTQSHGSNPCIICGRKCHNLRYRVYVNDGFSHILTADEFRQEAGEMGLFPIGANCLQKHPEIRPYVQPVNPVSTQPFNDNHTNLSI